MNYHPHPESLAAKVIANLTLYPARVLGLDEIIEKFISARDGRNVHDQLRKAVKHGFLDYDRDAEVYSLGRNPTPSVLCGWGNPELNFGDTEDAEAEEI